MSKINLPKHNDGAMSEAERQLEERMAEKWDDFYRVGLESKKSDAEARDFADSAIAVVREFENVQFPGKPS